MLLATAFNQIAKQAVYNHWTGLVGWTGRLEWQIDIFWCYFVPPDESVTKPGNSKCSEGVMLSADLLKFVMLATEKGACLHGVYSVHACRNGFQVEDLLTQLSS